MILIQSSFHSNFVRSGNQLQACGGGEEGHGLSAFDTTIYPALADQCFDFFEVAVFPDPEGGCATFTNTQDQKLDCCFNKIRAEQVRSLRQSCVHKTTNVQIQACPVDDALGVDGYCYSLEAPEVSAPPETDTTKRKKRAALSGDSEIHIGASYIDASRYLTVTPERGDVISVILVGFANRKVVIYST